MMPPPSPRGDRRNPVHVTTRSRWAVAAAVLMMCAVCCGTNRGPLLDSVSGGDILVVGSHGHSGFVGAVLGSVSQHVVSHSRCPVVVIPAPQRAANG